MYKEKICISDIEKAIAFVNDINGFSADFDLISGRQEIDGKSLLAVLSMDLSKPVTVKVNIHDEREKEEIIRILEKYTCK